MLKKIRAVCSCFCKPGTLQILPICCALFAKSKERMRAPARFPVLEGRTDLQANISHCLTASHSCQTQVTTATSVSIECVALKLDNSHYQSQLTRSIAHWVEWWSSCPDIRKGASLNNKFYRHAQAVSIWAGVCGILCAILTSGT